MAVLSKQAAWNRRLGHASKEVFKKIQQIDIDNSSHFYDSYIKAKQNKLHFPISFSKIIECFELIHLDIWGRY